MSIRIEIIADSVSEMVLTLRQMADNFSGASSVVALDGERQTPDTRSASSGDLGEGKRRGRPPKAKGDVPPEPPMAEPDEAPADEAEEIDLQGLVNDLTERFKNGDADTRTRIRNWRDEVGLGLLSNMDVQHAASARALINSLGA